MKPYLITYDLDKPGQEYHQLIQRLKELGAVRVQYSDWLLRISASAAQIRDDLMRFTDSNDRLLVVGLTGEAAWTNLMISHEKVKQSLAA
jgi:CRISPR-associated endonuclease Cas2